MTVPVTVQAPWVSRANPPRIKRLAELVTRVTVPQPNTNNAHTHSSKPVRRILLLLSSFFIITVTTVTKGRDLVLRRDLACDTSAGRQVSLTVTTVRAFNVEEVSSQ
jgi:hypothetical protein